jgi:PAS domain S-box-containing protein
MPEALRSTPSDPDVRSALLKSKAMDTSATGIAITDPDGLYVYMNQAHARIFGYDSPTEMHGMHWSILYTEQKHIEILETVFPVMGDQGYWNGIMEAKSKQGDPVIQQLSLALSEDGGIVCTTTDITEQIRSKEELAARERLLTSLIENSGSLIYVKNTDRTFSMWNRKSELAMGLRRDYVIGKTSSEVFGHETGSLFEETDRLVLEHGETVEAREIIGPPDDRKHYHSIKFPITDNKGTVIALCGMSTDITGEVRRTNELSELSQRLKSIIDTQTAFMIRTDLSGTLTFHNPKYLDEFGWLYDGQILGRSVMDAVCEHHRPLVTQTVLDSIAHPGKVSKVDIDKPKRDGGCMSTLWEFVCIPDADGHPFEMQCIGLDNDISHRMQGELQASETRFRQMFEQHHIPKLLLDATTGDILQANSAAANFYGMSQSSLVEKSIFDLVSSDHTQLMEKMNTVQTEGTLRCEMVHRAADKRNVPVEVFAGKVTLDGRDVIYSIITDVSERVKATNLADQLMNIVSHANTPIALFDTNGVISYLNHAAAKLIQVTEEDIERGLHGLDWFTPESTALLKSVAIPKAIEQGYWSGKTMIRSKNGVVVPVLSSLVCHRDANDVVLGYASIMQDVSDLEATNNELVKINAELDRFVYSTSHDLRAPLTSVMSLIDLAEDLQPTGDMAEYLELMKSSINRTDQVIRNILIYSRNSRMEVTHDTIDLYQQVSSYFDSIRHQPMIEGIRFEIDIAPKTIIVSDRIRLESIYSNLISNAFKYHRDSGDDRFVRISFWQTDTDMVLTVADNGTGILNEHKTKLFQMFTRFSEHSQGSGLGLYICSEIVTKLGGRIDMDSTHGKGSTFTVHLPKTA